ncbi:MAG: class I SAM-dependent methyltransferase [Ignavibacterium sp.]|jgi:ubiquinone/menaquinone biosynthesis C-methylase UbiE|nr:class I SAM-dependent methyltransferase [Ignavibacterium sp.]
MNNRVYNNGIERLRSPERIERLEVERVVELCLDHKKINSVLDIGTGSGLFAEGFYKLNKKVTGIDINPEMLTAAKVHLPDVEFRIAHAEELPFDDNTFDLVFMGVIFHEVDDYIKALQESKRVAVRQVSILEYKYIVEESGPPIEHRLKEEFLKQLSEEAGFSQIQIIPLKNLVLYHFIK